DRGALAGLDRGVARPEAGGRAAPPPGPPALAGLDRGAQLEAPGLGALPCGRRAPRASSAVGGGLRGLLWRRPAPAVLPPLRVAAGHATRDAAGWAPDLAGAACALARCSAHQAAAVAARCRVRPAVVAAAPCSVRRMVVAVALRLVHLAAHAASRQARWV